jgi:hypothetical protein
MSIRNSQTYDNLLLLKDAGAITASGAATVASAARVLDLGPARTVAKVIVDTAITDLTTGDETYRVALQGSNDITFAAGVVELGSVSVTAAGRSELQFTTQPDDTPYRYVRAYFTLAGTSPSINATAFIAKD